jgi:hypothetical protein
MWQGDGIFHSTRFNDTRLWCSRRGRWTTERARSTRARALVGARSSASEDFLAGKIERPSQGMPEPCIVGATIFERLSFNNFYFTKQGTYANISMSKRITEGTKNT